MSTRSDLYVTLQDGKTVMYPFHCLARIECDDRSCEISIKNKCASGTQKYVYASTTPAYSKIKSSLESKDFMKELSK